MDDLGNLLFSAVFVVMGSMSFHIASLISGFNVYRELSVHHSTLVTTAVGVVLFAVSPISFLIFFPQQFVEQTATQVESTAPVTAKILNYVFSLDSLFPFFLTTSGLGLIFGCFTIIGARSLFLDWLRETTKMRFSIYSYNYAWDDLLGSVKKHGTILVKTKGKQIWGRLYSFSVRDEPREVILYDFAVIHAQGPHSTEVDNGKIFIRGDDIEEIKIPVYSFNRHFEHIPHYSQAFYLSLAAMGFFAVAAGAYYTGIYIQGDYFPTVTRFYNYIAGFFFVSGLTILLVSLHVSRLDFNGWRNAFVICPMISTIATIGFAVVTYLLVSFFSWYTEQTWFIALESALVVVLLGSIFIYRFTKIRKDLDLQLKKIIQSYQGERDTFSDLVDKIYLEFGLNEEDSNYTMEGFRKNYHSNTNMVWFFKELDDFLKDYPCYIGEEFNLMVRLQYLLRPGKKRLGRH